MKFLCTMLFILVALFFIPGCSSEEPDNYEVKNVVRKAVKKPPKTADIHEETKKEISSLIEKDIDKRISQETLKNQALSTHKSDIYETEEGDTLMSVSGKNDIYGNPLKWPLLYRDNPEEFFRNKDESSLFETSLSAGMKLKISPHNKAELTGNDTTVYVINIVSSPHMKKLAPLVVKLIDDGYYVYLTETMLQGDKWYRLRAGFYRTRSEAERAGEKLKKILRIKDTWTTKIENEEFLDFGGY